MKTKTTRLLRKVTRNLVALLALTAVPAAFAASQTWSAAPTDQNWTTAANWVGNAVPGALNQTGNSVNNDVVTFNAPIPGSNIGTAGLPILVDDGTNLGARGRTIGGITFDTANCGTYIISSLSPPALPVSGVSPETGILNVCHNGSIQMTASVTNSQVLTIPLYVRLPSSTAGIYNLVNNSTNAATLYIAGITNDSANTRGTVFTLGGSNTGTNTIESISAGTTTSGANGLTKTGSGRWIISGPCDFRAQTVVRVLEGTLEVNHPSVFDVVTTGGVTITNTGVLQINGVTLNTLTFNLHNGGTIRMNGTAGVNGVAVGTAANTVGTLTTMNASDEFTVGTGFLASSLVSGGVASSVLQTAGPGTILLGTANTYVGNWSFGASTNKLIGSTPLASSRNVNVAAGAILDASAFGYYTLSSVSFSANGTGTAVGSTAATITAGPGGTFDFGSKNITFTFAPTAFAGDTTHPSLYVSEGAIALNANFITVNNTSGTPLGVGTYRLIQQASGSVTVSGTPFAVVLGAGLAAGTIGDIMVSGGNVDLVVSAHAAASLSWQGGNPDNVWDSLTTANWNNGVGFVQFGNGDAVTFGPLGSSFPSVNIAGTMLPASVKVDTSANDYTFSGAGQIAGPASLTKVSSGVLNLQTANGYLGGTTVSNGTVRVGVENAIPSSGTGNVAVYGTGVIDLNGFNNTVNGLSGDGSVDNQAAATVSVLTAGNNNSSGTFSGQIKSTAGSVALNKIGTGALTLNAANTYTGPTTNTAGTLNVGNTTALGVGDLVVNAGTVNLQTGLQLNSLAGGGGTIANNANANTNKIVITGSTSTTCAANIADGSGGGGVGVAILGGSLTLSGNSTYTGGTIVGSGATFAIPNGPAAVGGYVVASNASQLFLSGGSSTPGTPNAITTVAGAKVIFNSQAEGKIWNAQFNGSVNSTNRFIGPVSAGQALSFSNFLGVVEFANTNDANLNFRFFNGGGISGGENTLFVFEHVNVHTRDSQTVRLGDIVGGNTQAGIGDQAGTVSWEIGAKNNTRSFQGYIQGVNNSLVKVGTGTLTLDGRMYYTNTVTLPDTSVVDYALFTNALAYLGSTTVSNGVLKIVAPNNLNVSSNLNLAGGVLDATQIGSYTNQTTLDISSLEQPTNSVAVVSGLVDILATYTLNGFGSVLGNLSLDAAAVNNVGDYISLGGTLTKSIGTMAVSGSYIINGTVNMDLNRSNPGQNCDKITAASFSGSGATLNITNVGPTLIGGTTFQLFNHGVSAFTSVNLPATDASGQITYTWDTSDLTVGGSITLTAGLSTTPVAVNTAVSGNTLQISWPTDHIGWTLQNQTNALNVGITSTWYDVAGSATTNQVFRPINPANPTVFYRLTLPLP